MPSVLFVCTANHYRSPIAAALFKAKLSAERRPGRWDIRSAGTWTIPDLPPTPLASRLARRCGLSLQGHRTSLVSGAQLMNTDLILVMEAGHKEALLAEFPFIVGRVFLISEVVDQIRYDVPDPAHSPEQIEKFLRELCQLVERGYETICELAESLCPADRI